MGTRGAIGFVVDGVEKVSYNHFDSYPDGLGKNVVEQVRAADLAKWREQAKALVMIKGKKPPTADQIEALSKFADESVSSGQKTEWYVLLRGLQGDMQGTLDAGYMIDSHMFLKDSLFCEYAYIVNFDTGKLECYRGFQRKRHNKGRYGRKFTKYNSGDRYYGVALECEFDLANIPEDWQEQFENTYREEE